MEKSELVASIILCDGVIVEQGTGKHTLIGCFHGLGAAQFPIVHPGITAFVSITNFREQKVCLDITVRIQDKKTSHVIASASGHVEAQLLTGLDPKDSTLDFPMRFSMIAFPQPGTYTVIALVNNDEVGKQALEIFIPPQSFLAPPTQQ